MARTYISLFSSAGVGCYGFKMNGFECVATNELLEPRLAIQQVNHKCKYDSGYILGDATNPETHYRISEQIDLWRRQEGLQQVDVVFATPPCQGMSTVNYKKNDHEQIRNSLVVEAIKMVRDIHPKIFVFENVRAFMKSTCTDITGKDMSIRDSIYRNLSEEYNIYWKVINFKDYGVPSSRPRTLVIGTSKELHHVTPLDLFPTRQREIPLRESIGGFASLEYGTKDAFDPFHFARPFPKYMLEWIEGLKEGETAFNNPDDKKPYQLDKEGKRVINKGAYMGNKYRRLIWDRPGACIATRSDVMSSQDTIHPCDNRVLSIRELMTLMTIPADFLWTEKDNELTVENSDEYLKENEGNIRRCIGEAVPTHIGFIIANKIKLLLDYEDAFDQDERMNAVPNNVYCESHEYRGFAMDPQSTFDIICRLSPNVDRLTVKVDSISSFVTYIPMFVSYFSEAESINIDVVKRGDDDDQILRHLIDRYQLGTNTHVELLSGVKCKHYSHIVQYDGCYEISKQAQKVKKEEIDQLSLFN